MTRRARLRISFAMAGVVILNLFQSAVAQLAYETNNGAITITGYSGSGPNVTIPPTFNGYPVTTIGNAAFGGNRSVTRVTIPNSITNIGAFAFAASGLVGISIPGSVIGIGYDAFVSCDNLANISVTATNPAYSSSNGVLFDKAMDSLIQYPIALTNNSYTVPAGVGTISDDAFYGAPALASVVLPRSVASIGNDAFAYCVALNAVYFAGNAPGVGSYAFYETGFGGGIIAYYLPGTTGWTQFSSAIGSSLAASNFWYQANPQIISSGPNFGVQKGQFGFLISWATNATLIVDACTSVSNPIWLPISTNSVAATNGTAAFADAQWSIFPTRFYRIRTASSQFEYSTSLGAITITGYTGASASVSIPATINGYPITGIGNTAFANDANLKSVTIPGSVTNIGDFAFEGSGLTSVNIPASVISLGQSVFALCNSLTNISVDINNPAYSGSSGVLFDKAGSTLVQYPAGLTGSSYTIPNGVRKIGDRAFYGTSSLSSITIPGTVTAIGDNEFTYCIALTTVYFGGNAPSVGSFAFYETGFGGGVTVNYLPGTAGWPAFIADLGQSLAGSLFWYLPSPQIMSHAPSFGVHNNQFGFTISWATNATVIVESCTNLANPVWLPISTNTLTSMVGTASFNDPQFSVYLRRYYRLR